MHCRNFRVGFAAATERRCDLRRGPSSHRGAPKRFPTAEGKKAEKNSDQLRLPDAPRHTVKIARHVPEVLDETGSERQVRELSDMKGYAVKMAVNINKELLCRKKTEG